MNRLTLKDFYPNPESNGYGEKLAFLRFNVLKDLQFNSVLDVGSGPCLLQKWLINNKIESQYEAVDIRDETLSLCKCKTYNNIPLQNNYDLVCIFGTVTFNIDKDFDKNKSILKNLIHESVKVSKKYIVLTVFKNTIIKKHPRIIVDRCVFFSEQEIKQMFYSEKVKQVIVKELDNIDKNEYFVFVYMK